MSIRRVVAILTAGFCLSAMGLPPSAALASPSVAEAVAPLSGSEAAAFAAGGAGTANVRIKTPSGVPVNVFLVGPTMSQTVSKSEAGKSATVTAKVPAGVYRVKPESVVFQGRLFVGKALPTKLKVRGGKTVGATVTYRAVAIAGQVQATGITQTTISLSWTAPEKAKVSLRRLAGAVAPASQGQGTSVVINGSTATDSGLAAGTQYSYSLFTRLKGHWSPPVTFTAGTSAPQGSGVAAYVAASTTTILPPSAGVGQFSTLSAATSAATVGEPTGTGVRVHLGADVPTPVMGSAMVLPISAALPGGYLGKVVSMTPDGRTVNLEPASMTEAFDYYSIDVTDVSGPEQELVQAASVRPLGSSASRGQVGAAGLLKCGAAGGSQVTFNPSVKLGGSFKGTIEKVGPVPKSASLSARLMVTLTGAASVSWSGSLNCSVPFAPVSFMLATTPVPIAFSFKPRIEAKAAGSVSISNIGYQATGGVAFEGSISPTGARFQGGAILEAHPLTPVISANGPIGLVLGGDVLVGPGVGTPSAGVMAAVGGYLNPLDAAFEPQFPMSDGRFNACSATTAKMSAGLNVTAKAWFQGWEISRTVTVEGLNREWKYGGPWYLPSGCNNLPDPRPANPPPANPPPANPPPVNPPPANPPPANPPPVNPPPVNPPPVNPPPVNPPPVNPPPVNPPPAQTWSEQSGSHGSPTFRNPVNASDQGPTIPAMSWVQVVCKVRPATTIGSAYPDGYWYRIASAPWNGEYYAVANTFWNGDVPGQLPYTHNTDWSVPDC